MTRQQIFTLVCVGLGSCFSPAKEGSAAEAPQIIKSEVFSNSEEPELHIGPTPDDTQNRSVDVPGMKRLAGLNAPESEAIKFILLDAERYRDDFELGDFHKLEDASFRITSKGYITNATRDYCKYLLSLDGNYASKEDIAEKIADELTGVDRSESEHVTDVFRELLGSVSTQARQLLLAKKLSIHMKVRSTIEDYYYTAANNPDSLIARRVGFCSRI